MQIETDIESLMDTIHQAIVSADFAQMQSLAPQIETALLDLPPDASRKVMARLRAKAKRNAQAALASGKGVRAAIQRLDDVRQNSEGLITYDENGKRPSQIGKSELSRRL